MTMLFALDENKNLLHITDALRGLACNCICFECGEAVLARKGDIKEHHFAHTNHKESCNIQPESILHKYAKQIIIEAMGLMLPSLPMTDTSPTWWQFDQIIPEFNLGRIRPDLTCYHNKEPIFIEIAVTHFLDSEKLTIIQNMNIKTIEIDLSDLLKSDMIIPSDEAKNHILLQLNNKKWLYPETKQQDAPSIPLTTNKSVLLSSDNNISMQTSATWEDFQFTIQGMWVHARKFSGGMLSLNCSYNPELIALFKQWRNEGGGRYHQKYKSWNYWQPFATTVLERLHAMHSTERNNK